MRRPPKVPGQRATKVEPPPRFASEPPTKPARRLPAASEPSAGQLVMKLAGELANLPEEAKANLLEVLPVLAPLLIGDRKEVRRRFLALVAALHPVLLSKVPGTDKRVLEAVSALGQLGADDQTLVARTAARFVAEPRR